jgi:hypothetical protein
MEFPNFPIIYVHCLKNKIRPKKWFQDLQGYTVLRVPDHDGGRRK